MGKHIRIISSPHNSPHFSDTTFKMDSGEITRHSWDIGEDGQRINVQYMEGDMNLFLPGIILKDLEHLLAIADIPDNKQRFDFYDGFITVPYRITEEDLYNILADEYGHDSFFTPAFFKEQLRDASMDFLNSPVAQRIKEYMGSDGFYAYVPVIQTLDMNGRGILLIPVSLPNYLSISRFKNHWQIMEHNFLEPIKQAYLSNYGDR
ncbi:MAG: hypothetical protein NDI94_04665 [Candidatus Woesearchaeota archaeon]|nr:hypothetical protein [Candidatus Woesearchaeota archaeon]